MQISAFAFIDTHHVMLYTSYFAKMSAIKAKLANDELPLQIVSIARWSPKWFRESKLLWLAPGDALLTAIKAGKLSNEAYELQYRAQLDKLLQNNPAILPTLTRHALQSNIVMLCYEAPGKFCHRHILAKWLTEHTGLVVKELEF